MELVADHVYTWHFAAQVAAVLLAIFAARRLAFATTKIHDYGSQFIQKLKENKVITFFEVCMYIYLLTIIWIEQSIFTQLKFEPWFVTITLVVVVIWILLRSSILLASQSAQSRIITFVLWLLILLSFFGQDTSTLNFMKNANIRIAEFNINLFFVLEAVIIFTILLWAAQFLSELSKKHIKTSSTLSPSSKVLYTKISRVALFVLAGLIGLTMLGVDLTIFAVFTGALGLGLGIGLQRVFANFVSGIILLLDKSVKPGDALEIDGNRGIVDHMYARYFSVFTNDGKHILIPNESAVTEKVHNWSFDNHRNQLHTSFTVTFGSDLDLILGFVTDILHGNKDILQDPHPSCLLSDFTDSGAKFDMRYWVDGSVARTNRIKNDILLEVSKALKKHNIEFAQGYPTPHPEVKKDKA